MFEFIALNPTCGGLKGYSYQDKYTISQYSPLTMFLFATKLYEVWLSF